MFEYLRACQVVAGTATGIRINLLRFKFKVINSIKSYPSALTLEIYNLNRSEQTRFEKEFTRIFVFAGYVYSPTAQPKMIFSGNIKNVVFRKDSTEVITTIYAGDYEEQYKNTVFSRTFQGKTPIRSVISSVASSFPGVVIGRLDGLDSSSSAIRGFTESGKTSTILDKYAKSNNFEWWLRNGVFNTTAKKTATSETVIVVKSETGLLDAPEVTESGVNVKTLLNADYFPRRRVKIDTSQSRINIQEATIVRIPRTKGNGVFRIEQVTHTGDTRGDQWNSLVECSFFN